jgi:hypothetical protein
MLRFPVSVTAANVICVPNNSSSAANGNHEETLALLIQTTEGLVCKHIGIDASVMTSVAQRVDPGLKIKASIE